MSAAIGLAGLRERFLPGEAEPGEPVSSASVATAFHMSALSGGPTSTRGVNARRQLGLGLATGEQARAAAIATVEMQLAVASRLTPTFRLPACITRDSAALRIQQTRAFSIGFHCALSAARRAQDERARPRPATARTAAASRLASRLTPCGACFRSISRRWKAVAAVDIVAHRVLWSLPFLAVLIARHARYRALSPDRRRRPRTLGDARRSPRC